MGGNIYQATKTILAFHPGREEILVFLFEFQHLPSYSSLGWEFSPVLRKENLHKKVEEKEVIFGLLQGSPPGLQIPQKALH